MPVPQQHQQPHPTQGDQWHRVPGRVAQHQVPHTDPDLPPSGATHSAAARARRPPISRKNWAAALRTATDQVG